MPRPEASQPSCGPGEAAPLWRKKIQIRRFRGLYDNSELKGRPIHDMPDDMDETVAHFLELRVQVRHNREACALVDRCLMLIARAQGINVDELPALYLEVEALGDELALRFGAPRTAVMH